MEAIKKRLGKNDLIFIVLLAAALAALLLYVNLAGSGAGAFVQVTVDGAAYGTYPLSVRQEVDIVIDGVTTNVLIIEDNRADMVDADCPDRLCVHQKAISKNNETIVCLPNKVVVQITGGEESEFDSIAK
jgi:hypothetical protein